MLYNSVYPFALISLVAHNATPELPLAGELGGHRSEGTDLPYLLCPMPDPYPSSWALCFVTQSGG